MKVLYTINPDTATLHLAKGNSKLGKGIWGFSTLPGNEDHLLYIMSKDGKEKILLTDVPGTCSKYCEHCAKDAACYAWRDAKLHHNAAIKAWAENTILLRSGKIFDMIDAFITSKNAKYTESKKSEDIKVRVFRINVSGEIQNLKEFESWNDLALKHPEVTFGVYTKNFDDLAKFLDKHGSSAPNMVINVSQWHHVADSFLQRYTGKINVFEYDDSNLKNNDLQQSDLDRLAATHHCPAVTKQGHHAALPDGSPITCDHCKRCYRKTGETTAVYAH